jgi:hypothetical protein
MAMRRKRWPGMSTQYKHFSAGCQKGDSPNPSAWEVMRCHFGWLIGGVMVIFKWGDVMVRL